MINFSEENVLQRMEARISWLSYGGILWSQCRFKTHMHWHQPRHLTWRPCFNGWLPVLPGRSTMWFLKVSTLCQWTSSCLCCLFKRIALKIINLISVAVSIKVFCIAYLISTRFANRASVKCKCMNTFCLVTWGFWFLHSCVDCMFSIHDSSSDYIATD